MKPHDFQDHLTAIVRGQGQVAAKPWHHLALHLLVMGAYQLIPSRDGSELYLARFWLNDPKTYATGAGDGSPYESGDSLLLHYFAQGDDDGALHDHPWDYFTTDVLSGGYTERRPPAHWRDTYQVSASTMATIQGLPFDRHETLIRRPGDPRQRRTGHDQHAVEDVLPETWTAITTGPRVRPWGFHPPGRSWIPWREFLAEKRAAVGGAT